MIVGATVRTLETASASSAGRGALPSPRRFVECFTGQGAPPWCPIPAGTEPTGPGLRRSLTPGSSTEVSVSSGAGRNPMALRYVVDLGANAPSMLERLRVQYGALEQVTDALPPPVADEAISSFRALLAACFPPERLRDPGPAFIAWIGVEQPDGLGGPAAVKLYANVTWDDEAFGRACAVRPALRSLGELLPSGAARPDFVCVQFDADGGRAEKLYVDPGPASHQVVVSAAGATGTPVADVLGAVHAAGFGDCLWEPRTKVCLESRGGAISCALHLGVAGLPHAGRGPAVERFAAVAGLGDAVRAVQAAADASGWRAVPTVVSLRIAPGGTGKRTIYFAPPP